MLAGKPVLIGATGGTARHSLALEYALRPLFSYLRTVVVPTAVYAARRTGDRTRSCPTGSTGPPASWPTSSVRGRSARRPSSRPAREEIDDELVPFERLLAGYRPSDREQRVTTEGDQ